MELQMKEIIILIKITKLLKKNKTMLTIDKRKAFINYSYLIKN